jgi:dTDP-glucose pyrophosphorylase/predicted transcriptional regulator
MDINQLCVPANALLKDVISVIDAGAAQIALVIEADRLVGLVTDGDVRRGLLRGESLLTPVANIMKRDFRFLPVTATPGEALALMHQQRLHQIPVLDDSGKVINLFLFRDLVRPHKLPNSVVIMAGGQGKRLRPLTHDCPKPMLKVAGKPLLEIILNQCLDAGFEHFYFAVNYLKEQIQTYFQDGSSWGASIFYLEEDKPLGTAGALSLLPQPLDHPILVINGDILTRVDYINLLQFHSDYESTATLAVREYTTQIPYGVVRMDDVKVVAFEEKPKLSHFVNTGIYLLNPDVLNMVPKDSFIDMPQLLETITAEGKSVNAFPVYEYWLDIGGKESLKAAQSEWPTSSLKFMYHDK